MKKLFNFCLLAAVTACFVSCSKSAGDMTALVSENARMSRSRESSNPSEMWTKIFNQIREPRPTVLGNPDSYLFEGDQAVFYVIISDEISSDAYTGMLGLVDEATGNNIQTINLLPMYDPGAANLNVPEEVAAHPFMFAIAGIDSQYAGKTVSLQSTVQLPTGETSSATLQSAFMVQ